jgi:catechol 2,3-dioxygenase-like lactoylglutathione lyase family enzyme
MTFALKVLALIMWALATLWQAPPVLQGLDHMMVAVTNLESAAERYRALGFALKPGQPHANGLRNQHVKFANGTELELITAPAAVDTMTANYVAHLRSGDGPAYAGFFAPDRARLTARLDARKLPYRRSGALTTFPDGHPLKHLFFGARNHSPTDRPEHFAHANGAVSLMGVWLATDEADTQTMLTSLGVTFEAARLGRRTVASRAEARDLH